MPELLTEESLGEILKHNNVYSVWEGATADNLHNSVATYLRTNNDTEVRQWILSYIIKQHEKGYLPNHGSFLGFEYQRLLINDLIHSFGCSRIELDSIISSLNQEAAKKADKYRTTRELAKKRDKQIEAKLLSRQSLLQNKVPAIEISNFRTCQIHCS